MVDDMKRYLTIYKVFLIQYLKRLVQYRMDFLIGAASFVFVQFAGVLFIGLVFSQIPDLNGYSFDEMMFLYGFFQIPRGLDHLFTDNIWLIPQKIRRGDIDSYLVRPINPLFQLISERFQQEAFGELIVGITLIFYSIGRVDLRFGFFEILATLLLILIGALIYTSIKLLTGSISFWIMNSMQLMTSVYNLADFAKYPTPIFPVAIQVLITYVVPFAFVSFLPASYLMRKTELPGVLFGSVMALTLIGSAALWLWHKGLNSYQSSGS
jgi:ABC-2 type transport system permease protein